MKIKPSFFSPILINALVGTVISILFISNNVQARCCNIIWDNRVVQTCDGDPSFAGIECVQGWDWDACACKGTSRSLPPPSSGGGGVSGGGSFGPPPGPPNALERAFGLPRGPVSGPPVSLLQRNALTLACGCYGLANLWQQRVNQVCASGYDTILPCPGQCPGGGVPWGARCY